MANIVGPDQLSGSALFAHGYLQHRIFTMYHVQESRWYILYFQIPQLNMVSELLCQIKDNALVSYLPISYTYIHTKESLGP